MKKQNRKQRAVHVDDMTLDLIREGMEETGKKQYRFLRDLMFEYTNRQNPERLKQIREEYGL